MFAPRVPGAAGAQQIRDRGVSTGGKDAYGRDIGPSPAAMTGTTPTPPPQGRAVPTSPTSKPMQLRGGRTKQRSDKPDSFAIGGGFVMN